MSTENEVGKKLKNLVKSRCGWWQESVQKIYPEAGSALALTNSISRQRLTGFSENQIAESVSFDSRGNQTVSSTILERSAKTKTQTTVLPDSASNQVSVVVNGLLQYSIGKTGLQTFFTYDALGRQTGVADPRLGNAVSHYDSHGWIDYVEDAAGNRTTFSYDSATGRIISQTDALTNTSYSSYTSHGQLEKTWGSGTYPVLYEYDGYDRMATMSTYRGGSGWDQATWPESPGTADTTTWGYQEATGLLTNKTDAAGKSVTYTYSAGGKLATRTWARQDGTNALITTYGYDTNTSELVSVDYSDNTPDVTFTLDRLGQQVVAESSVSRHEFSYSGLDLVSEIIVRSGITNTITRNYDGYGRPTGFALDSDYSVSYQYDTLGRFSSLSSSVESVSSVVNYSYLPNSDLISGFSESGSGLQVSRSYEDHRNLITQIKNEFGTNLISQFDYLNDSIGRRTQRIDFGGPTNDFAYNPRSELTNAVMGTNGFGYQYDPIGNRQLSIENDIQRGYEANALNQYTTISNGVTNLPTYDFDGNLTNDSVFAYTFNAENRLIVAEPLVPSSGSRKVEFQYDYKGRRVLKTAYAYDGTNWNSTADEVRRNIYDDFNLIAEIVETPGATNTLYYTWGLDLSGTLQGAGGVGGLLSMTRQTASSTNTFFYMADANGNISDLIDASGTSVAAYQYSPYGEIVSATGIEATNNTMTFSTKPWDGDIRKYGYIYRDYDSEWGRFGLSKDPIDDVLRLAKLTFRAEVPPALTDALAGRYTDANLYLFIGNTPVNFIDVLGLAEGKYILRDIPNVQLDMIQSTRAYAPDQLDGFEVEYVPADTCPCKHQELRLVQAVKVGRWGTPGIDVFPDVYNNNAQTPGGIPLPSYAQGGGRRGNHGELSYIDAPFYKLGNFFGGTMFYFETCALCPDDMNLGCVTFFFNDKDRKINPKSGSTLNANDPSTLWKTAANRWKKAAGKKP